MSGAMNIRHTAATSKIQDTGSKSKSEPTKTAFFPNPTKTDRLWSLEKRNNTNYVHLLKVNTTKNSRTVKLQAKLYFLYHPIQFHSSVYRVTAQSHHSSRLLNWYFVANRISLNSGLSLANYR